MAVAACTNVAGMNTLEATVEATHGLGDNVLGDDGNMWIYGVAGDAVSTGTCTYTKATGVITDAAGSHTADVAIPNGSHGWVRVTAGPHG